MKREIKILLSQKDYLEDKIDDYEEYVEDYKRIIRLFEDLGDRQEEIKSFKQAIQSLEDKIDEMEKDLCKVNHELIDKLANQIEDEFNSQNENLVFVNANKQEDKNEYMKEYKRVLTFFMKLTGGKKK